MSHSTLSAVNVNNCIELKGSLAPFLLIIRRGDLVAKTIVACADKLELPAAAVSGIGAIEDPEIAYYNLQARRYDAKKYQGIYELVSLIGNVSFNDGKRFLHAHVGLSKTDYSLFGGHLVEAKVGVIAEVLITPLANTLSRAHDDETNLHLIQTDI